jgi:hypothetical protein
MLGPASRRVGCLLSCEVAPPASGKLPCAGWQTIAPIDRRRPARLHQVRPGQERCRLLRGADVPCPAIVTAPDAWRGQREPLFEPAAMRSASSSPDMQSAKSVRLPLAESSAYRQSGFLFALGLAQH